MILPTYEQIKPYIAAGYVIVKSHPTNEDIKIFNYTAECQFDKKWDAVTLLCRGLIINTATGEHLSRPFPKFFNVDEHFHLGYSLPEDETPFVLEKLDGSLGILYFVNGTPMIATRGSFTSDQAIWATGHYMMNYDTPELRAAMQGKTYLFEIIYPENRIVVNYDYSDLVLLAIHDIETGATLHPDEEAKFRVAKKFQYDTLSRLKKHNVNNAEGYVLYYPKANIRVKIKFDDYVRLHKVVTGLSERGIWEMMVDKGITMNVKDVLSDIPDEFHKWMDSVIMRLRKDYNDIYMNATGVIREIEKKGLVNRKDQAIYINEKCSCPSVAFAMLDNKDHVSLIFRMIRPSAKTFKEDI